MELNEAKTRALLINPQLEHAGWNLADHSQVQFEVPVQGYDPTPWNGFTDFCLYHPDGTVLAVIEAKRTARNAREGEEQLRHYVTEIASNQHVPPFGFMTNGLHHYFWEVGLAHPRSIAGFFSPDDLERLRFHPRAQAPTERYPHQQTDRRARPTSTRPSGAWPRHLKLAGAARCSLWRPAPARPGPPWGSSICFCRLHGRRRSCSWPTATRSSSRR